jgi:hypothetical protein
MVMKSSVRVRVDESVQIGMPAEDTEQVIALQIRLSLLAIDEAAR